MAEHDKMSEDNQILCLGNVNCKIKREFTENTENKGRNIYIQREAGGQPSGAINWPKLRGTKNKTVQGVMKAWTRGKSQGLHAERNRNPWSE